MGGPEFISSRVSLLGQGWSWRLASSAEERLVSLQGGLSGSFFLLKPAFLNDFRGKVYLCTDCQFKKVKITPKKEKLFCIWKETFTDASNLFCIHCPPNVSSFISASSRTVFSVSAKMSYQDCRGAPKDRSTHRVKGMFHC